MSLDTINYPEPASGTPVSFDNCGASGEVQFVKLDVGALGTVTPASITAPVPTRHAIPPYDRTGNDSLDMSIVDSIDVDVSGCASVLISMAAPASGTVSFNYVTDYGIVGTAYGIDLTDMVTIRSTATPSTGTKLLFPCGGMKYLRIGSGASGTGSISVYYRASVAGFWSLFQSVDLTKLNGTTISVNNGTVDAGTQRVVLANDVTVKTELPTAAALSDTSSNPTAPAVGAFQMVWDGTQWVRASAPKILTLLSSAARTTQQATTVTYNPGYRGISVTLNVTAASGTGGLTVRIQETTPLALASGRTVTLMQATAAVTATGVYTYRIHPGAVGTTLPAGLGLVQVDGHELPVNWRIVVAVGDASSYTYSVEASLLP